MNKIVPLISSGVAGPLGVLHLPRFWQKVSLEVAGKLADGYPGCGDGYDQMVLNGLGLNKDATLDYITNSKPTYPQFESWVKNQDEVKLDKGSVTSLNAKIAGYIHSDETRKSILEANEIEDGPDAPHDAVNLNNLDDWLEFYNAEIK
ncbi:MAG: hypothetical protein M2R45_02683 [Verrucomicrobia subdivision 3 bacterium]|nr:hypothetical protein [Limisphaerales bacterium]MCS1414059.1 hypothetical protein [Limisphaerales bacterium]